MIYFNERGMWCVCLYLSLSHSLAKYLIVFTLLVLVPCEMMQWLYDDVSETVLSPYQASSLYSMDTLHKGISHCLHDDVTEMTTKWITGR